MRAKNDFGARQKCEGSGRSDNPAEEKVEKGILLTHSSG